MKVNFVEFNVLAIRHEKGPLGNCAGEQGVGFDAGSESAHHRRLEDADVPDYHVLAV